MTHTLFNTIPTHQTCTYWAAWTILEMEENMLHEKGKWVTTHIPTNRHIHWKGLFPWQQLNKTWSFNGTLSTNQKLVKLVQNLTLNYFLSTYSLASSKTSYLSTFCAMSSWRTLHKEEEKHCCLRTYIDLLPQICFGERFCDRKAFLLWQTGQS